MSELPELTPADWIAIERKAYESSLYAFFKAAWPILEPDRPLIESWHIEALCLHLEAVSRGEITRLAISICPGFAKSLLASCIFPTWIWTHSPSKRFLATGSSEAFCERDAGKMRTLLRSDWFQARWPITFPQVDTILRFENDKTGFRWARPFSSLTGGRGNILILDDVLPVDMANSEGERAKVNRRFFESATSRLESENDSIIIIMQRVHANDLIGEIMERQNKGEDLGFDFLTIPMEFDGPRPATSIGWTDPRTTYGELICPAYRSQKWVDREKQTMGVYAWQAQFAQDPVPRGDGFFKREDFKLYEAHELPKELNHYMTSDHALGLSSKGDFNVVRVWGVDHQGHYWLVDSFRERCQFLDAMGITLKEGKVAIGTRGALPLIKRYRPLAWFADSDNIIKANLETIKSAMRQTGAMCRLEILSQGGRSKVERASAYQTMASLGMIHLPDSAIGHAALAETLGFPTAKHDDQLDADAILPRVRAHAALLRPTSPAAAIRDYRMPTLLTSNRQRGLY